MSEIPVEGFPLMLFPIRGGDKLASLILTLGGGLVEVLLVEVLLEPGESFLFFRRPPSSV